MPEAASESQSLPETRAIVQRRLVGLAVLLLLAFLISLLLRTGAGAPDALPSVVIPLNGSGGVVNPAMTASTAPTLDAPEPEEEPVAPTPQRTEPLPPAVSSSKPTPKLASPAKPAAIAPKPVAKPAAKPVPDKPVVSKPVPAKPAMAPIATSKPTVAQRWFVAVGAYKDPMAAQAIANRVKLAGFSAGTVPITNAGERLHRVRAGPFANQTDAESARVTLIVEGLTKAVTVSEK